MLRNSLRLALLTLLCVADVAIGSPFHERATYAIKESFPVPRKWKRVGPAPQWHMINLRLAVRSNNFDELERQLYEVSSPGHSRYGQHLSKEQVHELVRPTDESLQLVHDWLKSNGVSTDRLQYSAAKDWIKVRLPVVTVERLLNTKYSVYKHDDGTHLVRAPVWSLPAHLHGHIDTIQPTNSFFRPKRQSTDFKEVFPIGTVLDLKSSKVDGPAASNVSAACNVTAVTPTCLRTLYGTIDYTPQAAGQNQVGLNNFLGEVNNRSDVTIFLQRYRPDAVAEAADFKTISINGGRDFQGHENSTNLEDGTDLEGNLDAETIIGITFPTPLTTFNTGGEPPFIPDTATPTDTNEPYIEWLNFVLNQTSLPQVISTSYGDDEQTVPQSYAETACKGFAQLGAQGISLLVSSGDSGVGSDDACVSNDGKNTSMFLPAFPAGCPYITTVGATMNIEPEIVAHDDRNGFTSGGGFSNYFARPSYQDDAVTGYLATLGDQFDGLFNKSGRGYPDLAAQGFHFIVIWNGTGVLLDGTSASAPTASSIISLVNDALLASGKSTLGFLNPWLYAGGFKAFTDVTNGSALGCGTTGFPAATGWDPVTGFGTPYFPSVRDNVLNGFIG